MTWACEKNILRGIARNTVHKKGYFQLYWVAIPSQTPASFVGSSQTCCPRRSTRVVHQHYCPRRTFNKHFLWRSSFFALVSQTFLLQVVTRNPDGTLCIIKSVPCSAGSSEDICMVEVSFFCTKVLHTPSER